MIKNKKYNNLNLYYSKQRNFEDLYMDKYDMISVYDENNYLSNIKQKKGLKPEGLWFYCGITRFNKNIKKNSDLVSNTEIYNFNIDKSKICIINNLDNLLKFNKLYGYKSKLKNKNDISNLDKMNIDLSKKYTFIKWDKVSKDYNGFKLCSFNMNKLKDSDDENDFLWVYNINTNSGCIWDYSCINDIHYGGYLSYNNNIETIINSFEIIIEKFIVNKVIKKNQLLIDDKELLKDDKQIIKDDKELLKDEKQIIKDDKELLKDNKQILNDDNKKKYDKIDFNKYNHLDNLKWKKYNQDEEITISKTQEIIDNIDSDNFNNDSYIDNYNDNKYL